jgi:pSer/pThr/pTyr-binding forkhead associated (FHA) protein
MTLPYLKVANKYETFSANTMNQVLGECLALSARHPCYLEVCNDSESCFLFFRDGQVYNAGQVANDQFSETSIRHFLKTATRLGRNATCYVINSKMLHSLLILFQKKASLRLSTSIVDLDEVLDKIEEEGKSCIVAASQDEFLAVLRYETGKVTALCHELSASTPKESSFREDFLVKIYTLSAEKPLSINVYVDLLVRYAADAKMIDKDYAGEISELYLSKPQVVTLEFKGKEISHWVLDRPILNIGRTVDNDIVIDNLAVSRLHAVLEKDKGEYYIRDCDSLNGTLVNNKKVGRAKLQHGDEIAIGKHKLKVQRQAGVDIPDGPNVAPFDQTVIIGPHQHPAQPKPQPQPVICSGPRLIEKTKSGEIVIEIDKPNLILGKDRNADVEVDGLLVAKRHAEIVQENGDYVIRHLNGYRKVSVGGKAVSECVLEDNAEIRIGNSEFIFQK